MLPEIRPSPASRFLSLAVAVGQAHKATGHLSPVAGEAVRLTVAGIARERGRCGQASWVGRCVALERADYAARRGVVAR